MDHIYEVLIKVPSYLYETRWLQQGLPGDHLGHPEKSAEGKLIAARLTQLTSLVQM